MIKRYKSVFFIINILILSIYSLPIDNNLKLIKLKQTPGIFKFYDTDKCNYLSCGGNNHDSPYAYIYYVSRLNPPYNSSKLRFSFDIFEDEAIELDIITPPRCSYYGFTLYLMDREDYDIGYDYFATINDTINLQTIEKQLGNSPFDQMIKIIITGNLNILNIYKRSHRINHFYLPIHELPSDILPLQLSMTRFSFLLRTTLIKDSISREQYIKNPPASVYRYKYNIDYKRLEYGKFKQRSKNGINENEYINDFNIIKKTVLENMMSLGYYINEKIDIRYYLNFINYDNGYDCIRTKTDCYGDNRDTLYFVGSCFDIINNQNIGFNLTENKDIGDIIIIIGLNHEYFNNTQYTSIQLYDRTNERGIFSFNNEEDINESSRGYKRSCKSLISTIKEDYDKMFYCLMISRNNYNETRLPPIYEKYYFHLKREFPLGTNTENLLSITERHYLQGNTEISPDKNMVIPFTAYIISKNKLNFLCN